MHGLFFAAVVNGKHPADLLARPLLGVTHRLWRQMAVREELLRQLEAAARAAHRRRRLKTLLRSWHGGASDWHREEAGRACILTL